MSSHAAKLNQLETQISGVMGSTSNALDAAVTEINKKITQINDDITQISSASSDFSVQQIGSLVADSTGMQCRALAGGSSEDMDAILPGGRAFTFCQPESAWANTTQSFATFMPAGATWTNATAAAVCTPLPARTGLFGESMLCADSLPEAMAYAVDLRTIRDRCLFADDLAGSQGDVTPRSVDASICTHKDDLAEGVFCSTVPKSTCNTTSMKNGIMCTWTANTCKSTAQAGNQINREQCTSA
jgi:uncharacterized protein YdcH (DUF465 family)